MAAIYTICVSRLMFANEMLEVVIYLIFIGFSTMSMHMIYCFIIDMAAEAMLAALPIAPTIQPSG